MVDSPSLTTIYHCINSLVYQTEMQLTTANDVFILCWKCDLVYFAEEK